MAVVLIALTTLLVLVLLPSQALAWGIGVHLQVGSGLLTNLHLFPAEVARLLAAWPMDYLYGCIAADITLGKKFTHYLNHCHSWRMGRKILESACTDPQKACAYGYLGHLAMDTVAHSYYVPFQMMRTFNTTLLKHTYWEMRFEADVPPQIWPLARSIARKNFRSNDALMRSVLSNTLFSFSTNKRIFNSLLLLSRLQHYQKMLRSLSRASRFSLDGESRGEYLQITTLACQSVLSHMEKSPFWGADPTGERALQAARMVRKNLNLLWLDGKLSDAEAEEILKGLRGQLREGITRPDQLLELLSESPPELRASARWS